MFLPLFPLSAESIMDYRDFGGAVIDVVNPLSWFDLLGRIEKNFLKQVPNVPGIEGIELPTPEEALKRVSPKLKEINVNVHEETGVDFAKFLGWLARVLRSFASVFIGLLETVSESLNTNH